MVSPMSHLRSSNFRLASLASMSLLVASSLKLVSKTSDKASASASA
jgi:hypothetical protein